MFWHALSYENDSERVSHTFGCQFGILLFHTEEEKKGDIQGQKLHIYGKYHHLVKELHFHPYKFHCVKPGPSSTKTKELIDLQEIVRATIASNFTPESILRLSARPNFQPRSWLPLVKTASYN